MKVDVEELGACKRRLRVEETPEVVQAAWEQAFARVRRQASLPGFRKGKLPPSMVRLHFADDIRQEVARRLIPEVYRQAVEQTRLRPVDEPELQDVQLDEGAALGFSAVVEVKPEIELGAYTGVSVAHTPKALEESEVDEAITHLREHHAEYRTVDRAADLGDLVIVDYTLTPEGMETRSQSGQAFAIGGGSVLPEIEEAVIGLLPGASREIRLRFPEDHRNETLRGKPATATVKLVEVKEKVLPELDDEFAKTVSATTTMADLREEIKTELEARRARENRRALEEAVVEALLATHSFPAPEALVLRQVGHTVGQARERLRQQGVDPDRVPMDYPKLLEDLRPGAERSVRRALLLEAIAAKEGIEPGDVDAEIDRLAQASGRPAPALKRAMEQSGDLEALGLSLREARTLDFLIERAQVTS